MFLLYQKKDRVYPESVVVDGKLYSVNAGFKNILRIFDLLDDDKITEHKKICKLQEWFFVDELLENVSHETAVDAFIGFLRMKKLDDEKDERDVEGAVPYIRQFCYNFDAGEIYASFLSEYDIDLIDVDMHWYKFKILLENLPPECAFKRKIELRFMDLNDYGGRPQGYAPTLIRAKDAVQLPVRGGKSYDLQAIEEIEEFNEIWGKAGN
jgi:hypothetical protein